MHARSPSRGPLAPDCPSRPARTVHGRVDAQCLDSRHGLASVRRVARAGVGTPARNTRCARRWCSAHTLLSRQRIRARGVVLLLLYARPGQTNGGSGGRARGRKGFPAHTLRELHTARARSRIFLASRAPLRSWANARRASQLRLQRGQQLDQSSRRENARAQ